MRVLSKNALKLIIIQGVLFQTIDSKSEDSPTHCGDLYIVKSSCISKWNDEEDIKRSYAELEHWACTVRVSANGRQKWQNCDKSVIFTCYMYKSHYSFVGPIYGVYKSVTTFAHWPDTWYKIKLIKKIFLWGFHSMTSIGEHNVIFYDLRRPLGPLIPDNKKR